MWRDEAHRREGEQESGMRDEGKLLPLARSKDLIIEELPDEVLVYDLEKDKAHCLNRTSALVWRHCDGRTTVPEMSWLLSKGLNVPVDEEVVWLALRQLGRYGLLQNSLAPSPDIKRVSRRDLMKYAPGALSLPLIMSVTAPTAAQVSSQCLQLTNRPLNCSCNANLQCESDNCCCGSCVPSNQNCPLVC
jgi:hypothetical protein